MSPRRGEQRSLAWTDVLLGVMGVLLVGSLAIGALSSIPLRVAGSAGSVLATVTWLGSVAANPSSRNL